MHTNHANRPKIVASLASIALLAAACGGSTSDADPLGAADEAGSGSPQEAEEGGGDWEDVLAAAREEGSVTIYTSQDPSFYDPIGETLLEEYGIEVHVFRDVDAVLAQRIDAEQQTGNLEVDLLVQATPAYVRDYLAADAVRAPVGPNFDAEEYFDELRYAEGHWEAAAFVTGLGWNTDLVPGGLDGYEDALRDEFAGQIGVLEPASPSAVDYWLWLAEAYGEEFVERLAELEPRVYNSALTVNEALVSGELSVAIYTNPPGLLDAQEAGAPVDVFVPEEVWGAHFYGVIFEDAPNPNAAQVLANHLVGPEGQSIVAAGIGTVRSDTEQALAEAPNVRYIDEAQLTEDAVRTFQEEWRASFQ